MKRIIIALDVPDSMSPEDFVSVLPYENVTAWEWSAFWVEVAEGVVSIWDDQLAEVEVSA